MTSQAKGDLAGQRRGLEGPAGKTAEGGVVVLQRGTLRVVSAGRRLGEVRWTSRGVGTWGGGGVTGTNWGKPRRTLWSGR